MQPCQVFISYKNSLDSAETPDARMAAELYHALTARGVRTFFAGESIGTTGVSRYKLAIDRALDECTVLVAVGTSAENLSAGWVRYEWDSFASDILSGSKAGSLFSYIDGMPPAQLPRTLRQVQCFERRLVPVEKVCDAVINALEKPAAAPDAAPEPPPQQPAPAPVTALSALDRMKQAAGAVARGMADSGYVMPYISQEMLDIIATRAQTVTACTAADLRARGLDPAVFQLFLAQKIARINDPDSCVKAFQLLQNLVDSWRVFLNEEGKVAAYWVFIALQEDAYARVRTGRVNEKDIGLEAVRFIDLPGRYKGYLLLAGTIAECRTRTVVGALYDSWLHWLEELARDGVFFDEVCSMVSSPGGNSSLQGLGMEYYADYAFGGRMYRYDLPHIPPRHYLAQRFPALTELYRAEYSGED